MKVLITGSNGYIGSNLFSFLETKGIDIVGIDKSFGINILDYHDYMNMDGIIHLAGISGIHQCNSNLEQATINNVVSTFLVFNAARKNGIPVIFTSSQAAKNPQSNMYALTKKMCEIEAIRMNTIGCNIKVFRLTNVYGGKKYLDMKDTVISKFVKAVKKDEDIIINGNGSQIRDFIHIDDVCDAIYKGLMCKHIIKVPIDIGTGIPISILELAKMFNHRFTFNKESDRIGISRNVADTFLAYKELLFKSEKRIEDYIQRIKNERI